MKKFRFLKSFWLAIVWTIVIFVLSVSPGVQLPQITQSPDKIGHFIAYALLSWLYLLGIRKEDKWSYRSVLLILTGVSLYGISLEFIQWFFCTNRYFEVMDMLANVSGTLISYLLFRLFINKKPKFHGF
ncbi:MAG: VanZ family protein [Saprospiraceae bacterium]